MIGLIGKKIGMTQIFDDAGKLVPVTVIEFGPNLVVARKTAEKDGYDAVVLGLGDMKKDRASKPYAGAASYIGKQSDYCKACAYDPKRRHGASGKPACPFNSLYWDFLLRHEARFARNPRMAMPYKAWAKMDEGERAATLAQAARWLARLDEL